MIQIVSVKVVKDDSGERLEMKIKTEKKLYIARMSNFEEVKK